MIMNFRVWGGGGGGGGGKWSRMAIAISQLLASLEPCFYARSIARMAPSRLTEKTFY